MKTLIKTGPMMAMAIALFGWVPGTARAAEPANDRGPVIKNLMSFTYRAPAAPAAEQRELTKRDIKRLTSTAETRGDHLKIARFWEAEANKVEAQASGYESAAATFRRGPIVKNLTAPNTAARYEFFAKGLRDEAKSDHAKAASHEQLAKEA